MKNLDSIGFIYDERGYVTKAGKDLQFVVIINGDKKRWYPTRLPLTLPKSSEELRQYVNMVLYEIEYGVNNLIIQKNKEATDNESRRQGTESYGGPEGAD